MDLNFPMSALSRHWAIFLISHTGKLKQKTWTFAYKNKTSVRPSCTLPRSSASLFRICIASNLHVVLCFAKLASKSECCRGKRAHTTRGDCALIDHCPTMVHSCIKFVNVPSIASAIGSPAHRALIWHLWLMGKFSSGPSLLRN